MKKVTLLLVFSAFATAAFAQTTPNTEVKMRDNGTTKVVTKTGRTNVGQALENTKDAAGNIANKTGSAMKRGAKKTSRAVKRGTQKAGNKTVEATQKAEAKTE